MQNAQDDGDSNAVRNPLIGLQPKPVSISGSTLRKRTMSQSGAPSRSPRMNLSSNSREMEPASRMPANLRPFGSLSMGENALLQDIERREDEEMLSRKYSSTVAAGVATKARSSSVADELGPVRPRRTSVESMDTVSRAFNIKGSKLGQLIDFMDVLVPKLQQRVNAYCIGFFLVCLLEIGGREKSGAWITFFICVVLIDCAMAIVDHSLFIYFIDPVFQRHYKIAYLLHGFNGPFGILLTIIIVGDAMKHSSVAKSFPNWEHTLLAFVIVVVCVCMKNWFTRKHYTALLEKRFVSKLFKLETWNILLSELATTKPPKLRQVSTYHNPATKDDAVPFVPKKVAGADAGAEKEERGIVPEGESGHSAASIDSTLVDSRKKSQIHRDEAGTPVTLADTKQRSSRSLHGSGREATTDTPSSLLHSAVPTITKIQKKVINVFADLVDATSKYNDEYEDDVDLNYVMKSQQASSTATTNAAQAPAGGSQNNRENFREDDVETGLELPTRRTSSPTAFSGAKPVAESAANRSDLNDAQKWALKSQLRRRKTFWELAARISSSLGMLRIWTYNGPVTIQRKFQAKSFGRSLYQHLSRGGKVELTVDYLRRILQEKDWEETEEEEEDYGREGKDRRIGESDQAYTYVASAAPESKPCAQAPDSFACPSSSSKKSPRLPRSRAAQALDRSGQFHDQQQCHTLDYNVIRMNSPDLDKDLATLLHESAVELFDPFHVGVISEDQCVAALCTVYKEARFAASSLNEYGELHQSLRTVIDVMFWLVMLVVLQVFLQLNLFTYILPFITLALTVSFALSTMLGNVFVAILFVFFMIPYDIGSKIYIGADPNTRIVGFVQSVSLLYTTINTIKNEIMKIPNHTLFSEKICNLQESGGCVYDISLCFNLYSPDNEPLQSRIDAFLEDIKSFVVVENRLSWKSCFIFATGVNSVENTITYCLWLTHRDNWQEVGKPLMDRTRVMQHIKAKQEELGLEFVKIKQSVELLHYREADDDHGEGEEGSGSGKASRGVLSGRAKSGHSD